MSVLRNAMSVSWLEDLAARRRFGMKPGLDRIAYLSERLGHPEQRLGRVIHIAGTNGKGAVAAILDAALGGTGARVARYTSPHLVQINERFCLGGEPMSDEVLEAAATHVASVAADDPLLTELTFFEALTAVAFLAFAEAQPDWTILETGLGGRLDATNVCCPVLSIITKIGLDHCDWLGDTVEKIAGEKAGIIKPGTPVVLGRNEAAVRDVIHDAAQRRESRYIYAPDLADESEIPGGFSLAGAFNRENAVTALAALKVLNKDVEMFFNDAERLRVYGDGESRRVPVDAVSRRVPVDAVSHRVPVDAVSHRVRKAFSSIVWPGRFQRVGDILIDGAHNPPAAQALAAALAETPEVCAGRKFALVAGFCGDKDIDTVLRTLAPFVSSGVAVRTANPRSLTAEETAARMRRAGIQPFAAPSLAAALARARAEGAPVLVAGSLFLAGEALKLLNALPWKSDRRDPSCLLAASAAQ